MLLTNICCLSLLPCLIQAVSYGYERKWRHNHERKNYSSPNTTVATADATTSSSDNSMMLQGFEWYVKKDEHNWRRLNGQLEKLPAIGVDRTWIPPATKAGANPSTGYDVYDLWDLGEFNQKGHVATSYGTKDELLALSSIANSVGITLLADGVLNQRSGADTTKLCQAHQVDPNNRLENTYDTQQISAWVGFEYPGRGEKYSTKSWGCDDFAAVDYDDATETNAIWKIEGQNNDFAADVSTENGNYDYVVLADIAYLNPSVLFRRTSKHGEHGSQNNLVYLGSD